MAMEASSGLIAGQLTDGAQLRPPATTARCTNNDTTGASKVPPKAALRSRLRPATRRAAWQLERLVSKPRRVNARSERKAQWPPTKRPKPHGDRPSIPTLHDKRGGLAQLRQCPRMRRGRLTHEGTLADG